MSSQPDEQRQVGTGVELIAAERERQVSSKGYKASHDDGHDLGELAMAAAVYATPGGAREYSWLIEARTTDGAVAVEHDEFVRPATAAFEWTSSTPRLWPFGDGWKPSPDNRIRELAKAGALIAAEIDRLERIEDLGA
jgi:hypothetical protein